MLLFPQFNYFICLLFAELSLFDTFSKLCFHLWSLDFGICYTIWIIGIFFLLIVFFYRELLGYLLEELFIWIQKILVIAVFIKFLAKDKVASLLDILFNRVESGKTFSKSQWIPFIGESFSNDIVNVTLIFH